MDTPITKDQFDYFCELFATTNNSKKTICKGMGISDSSVDKYIRIIGDSAARQYARAKEDQCEPLHQAIADRIAKCRQDIDSEEDPKKCNAIVQLCKIDIDAIKWDLSKRQPKVFGDKLDVTTNGNDIVREINVTPIPSAACTDNVNITQS